MLVTAFGVTGDVASTENREESHHVTLGADLVLFGSILWYLGTKPPSRKTTYEKGPFLLAAVGVFFALLDPIRHVLLDHDGVFVEPEKLAMYADGEGNLTPVGTFCKWSTILGLTMMMSGVLWFLGIPGKICDRVNGDEGA